jgi:hypothetical protein
MRTLNTRCMKLKSDITLLSNNNCTLILQQKEELNLVIDVDDNKAK